MFKFAHFQIILIITSSHHHIIKSSHYHFKSQHNINFSGSPIHPDTCTLNPIFNLFSNSIIKKQSTLSLEFVPDARDTSSDANDTLSPVNDTKSDTYDTVTDPYDMPPPVNEAPADANDTPPHVNEAAPDADETLTDANDHPSNRYMSCKAVSLTQILQYPVVYGFDNTDSAKQNVPNLGIVS